MIPTDPAPAQPLVSGTIIFLNAECFIDEAIQSVLAQTYENWELMLVDDGSTDGSTAIARSYAERYPAKIRYLEHPGHKNRGMSASRNLGIKHSQGEIMAFLDSDDVWEPNKLTEQVALLQAHPEAGMLYGRTLWWFSWTGKPGDNGDRPTRLAVPPDTLVQPPDMLRIIIPIDDELPCTCSVLVRREVIDRVGGPEESFRGQFEDMVFYAKIFLEYPVFVAGGCWDRYRQHPDSHCSITTRQGLYHATKPNPSRGAYLAWISDFLEAKGYKNTEVWKVLREVQWPYRHPFLYWWGELPIRLRVAIRPRTRLKAGLGRARQMLTQVRERFALHAGILIYPWVDLPIDPW